MSTPESSGGSRVPLGRAVVARQLGFGGDAAERPSGEGSDHQATQVPEEFRGAAGAVESGIQSGFQMAAAAGVVVVSLMTREGETWTRGWCCERHDEAAWVVMTGLLCYQGRYVTSRCGASPLRWRQG